MPAILLPPAVMDHPALPDPVDPSRRAALASEVSEREVVLRKLQLFFRNAAGAQILFIVIAVLLLFLVDDLNPPAWALAWCAVAALVALLRLRLAQRFLAVEDPLRELDAWRRRAVVGALVAGLVWAAGGVGFMTEYPPGRPLYVVFMAGMISASVATLSALPRAQISFTAPVSLAIIGAALLDARGSDDYILALAMFMLFFAILRASRHIHATLDASIRVALRLERASQALRAGEARLTMLLEHDPSALFLVTPESAIVYANPQAKALLGLGGAELARSRTPDILEEDDVECRVRHRDGRVIPVERRWVDLPDGNRLLALNDISERKRIEAELDQHRNHLEDLVERRTQALLEATERAERLARVKGEFLANMSHEVRTPLNGVLGFAEMGQRRSTPGSLPQDYFQRILKAGGQLLKLLNDILDYSRCEEGRMKTEAIPYALTPLLQSCLDEARAAAAGKGLELSLGRAPDLPAQVVGDPYRLKQVLGNLLDNAVKFTERGEVRLAARREDEHLLIEVRDSGIGIRPEQLPDLFQPFTQADGSVTRKYGGAGLGLAIAKRLTELMGGEIRVEFPVAGGSVFALRLPCVIPESGRATPSEGRLKGLRILLVEDIEENRVLLHDVLEYEAAGIDAARNGREGLEMAIERGPGGYDVVLMDVEMPVMNGIDATRALLALDPDLPVIAQTAYALEEELQRCLDVGMVDSLTKPIDHELLVEKIRRWARRTPQVL